MWSSDFNIKYNYALIDAKYNLKKLWKPNHANQKNFIINSAYFSYVIGFYTYVHIVEGSIKAETYRTESFREKVCSNDY